jgi:hypothetical protein
MGKLKNIYLASKAKLYLYLSPKTRGLEVDIKADADKETLTIHGISATMDANQSEILIDSVLSSIKGIKKIIYDK